ncbi:MAG: hypothetical protein AAF846_18710 [Chloroflexota bacterium]
MRAFIFTLLTLIAVILPVQGQSVPEVRLFTAEFNEALSTTTITWDIDAETVSDVRIYTYGYRSLIIEILPAQTSGTYTMRVAPRLPDDNFPNSIYGTIHLNYTVNGIRYTMETSIERSTFPAPYFSEFNNLDGSVASLPALVRVSWNLVNRPANSNLEFVQVMPDGRIINVELPRDIAWVSSSGEGIVNLQPDEDGSGVSVQVRLVDLTTGDILAVRDLSIYITQIIVTDPLVPTSTANPTPDDVACQYVDYVADICPWSQTSVEVAFQQFEYGQMIWFSHTREIYVLYDSSVFDWYPDIWDYTELPTETAPSGLFQPQRGFGNMWLNNVDVRGQIGWATTSTEGFYTTPLELTSGVTPSRADDRTYFNLPNEVTVWVRYSTQSWGFAD